MDDVAAEYARQAQVLEYSYVACLAFLAWETCLTFADEVDFLRSSPRLRWTKVAFVVLRYYALIVVLLNVISRNEAICRTLRLCGPPYCVRWYVVSTGSLQAVAGLQQFLMATRVYALYARSRGIYGTLFGAFIAEHATMALCTGFNAGILSWSGQCTPDHITKLSVGVGLPPLLYDTLLLVLTVRKCARGHWRRATLPKLLLRDGVWAFILIFGTYGVQSLTYFGVLSGPLGLAVWPWQTAASSLAASRLVLHIHREGLPGHALAPAEFSLTTFVPGLTSDDTGWDTYQ